jgi:hypothetical protein
MVRHNRTWTLAIVAGTVCWLGQSALADTSFSGSKVGEDSAPVGAKTTRDAGAESPQAARLPVFVPRSNRGAPALRIGGASRGVGQGLRVRVLVPEYDEAALTLSEQPTLPWHLSNSTRHPVNFTLVDPSQVEPLLDLTIPGPVSAGVHRVDLSAHGVRLEAGRRYQWFIAVVPEPKHRFADTVARGSVERVTDTAGLAAQIAAARPEERVGLLAGAGIWYDALETLHQQLPAGEYEAQRDALLAQVGIELGAEN